nr:MAG TPA: protein of unknown function (DUF932) [Crassvirales sp.]
MDNINYNEQKETYSFYSLKELPWHGLGTIVEEAKTPSEILEIANMDYRVELTPLYASFIPNGAVTCEKDLITGEYKGYYRSGNESIPYSIKKKGELIKTNYATYRTDTLDILGVVGSRYECVQNDVAIDFIFNVLHNQDIINKNNIIIETAGVLGKGERIFVTAKLPDFIIAKDLINNYILFTTTHDGSGSITACFTDIRVVCNNTLNMALSSCTNKMTFKHTRNVNKRLNEGSNLMRNAIIYKNTLVETLEPLSKIEVKERDAIEFIQDLFLNEEQANYVKSKGSFFNINNGDEMIATKTLNKMKDAITYIERGAGQDYNYGTALWLYNGITSYINNGINYKSNEDKFNSIMDGVGAKLNQKSYNLITSRYAA